MSPLRARMIEDMTLAGLAEGTQRVYVQAVRGVTAHYRRSPDLLESAEFSATSWRLVTCAHDHRATAR
jgi:hypothetical protein